MKWGRAHSFAFVHAYVSMSHFVVLFMSGQLLLHYLMQEFETCNTVHSYIEHVYKGNRILVRVIIAALYPIKGHTYFEHITIPYVQP